MFFGRRLYEWPEYKDVSIEANFKDAATRQFKPPKKAFQYYKSSEVHTKQKRRIHSVFFFLPVAIAFTIYNGWGIFSKIFNKTPAEIDPIVKMAEVDKQKTDLSVLPVSDTTTETTVNTPPPEPMHPFKGYDFIIKASIKSARSSLTYYEITNGEKSVFMTDSELKKIGYEINQPTDCASFLYFKGASVVAACSSGDSMTPARQRMGEAVTSSKPLNNDAPLMPQPLLDGNEFAPSPA
jgi:hypothetical protein